MIEVSNLVKTHGDLHVLNGISLQVKAGEVAAIIGPSGGGKSTLLRCINGLEDFQCGRITVGEWTLLPEGQDANRKQKLLALRRRVGMVFQQFNLFPHMSVLDNVLSGPRFVLGQPRDEAEPRAKELLGRVGLADKLAARPAQLSGGQQQRVAIARALAVNPSAILFDEPTSALDPKMASEVMRVIDDLANDERFQAAMVIVSHDLAAIRRVADTVHILERGRVMCSGSVEEQFGPNGPATKLHE